MYPIYLDSEFEGHDVDSFVKKMTEICGTHKKEGRALAFAFLIYDFKNPQIRKVLQDDIYWDALNEISGATLTVFSSHYKAKKHKKIRKKYENRGFEYMTAISSFENPNSASNKIAKKYFEETKITFPSLLFFQVDDNKVIDSLLIELKEKTIEESALEIQEYIQSAIDGISKVTNENKKNYKEMFDLISQNVSARETKNHIKRVSKDAGSVVGLVSSVVGLT